MSMDWFLSNGNIDNILAEVMNWILIQILVYESIAHDIDKEFYRDYDLIFSMY